MILSIDESVGHLLNQIEQSGLDENTLIFFTSDGGHLWGEHDLSTNDVHTRSPFASLYWSMVLGM